MAVTNLSSVKYHEGRKIFSIKAEKIEISPKKMGFFRMGFFKTATIHGLRIDYFAYPDITGAIAAPVDFKQFLQANDAIPIDQIKELKIKGIEIYLFHHQDHWQSSIKCDSAGLDFFKRDFILSGNVSILSADNKKLQTSSLRWVTDKNQLIADGDYILTTGESIVKGKGLSCDYFLTCVDLDSIPDKQLLTKKINPNNPLKF
jgi:hypothetical protein